MQKPRLSFWQIWNMSFGFLGIQFGWGLQIANMSPIYKYLHAEESSLPYLWLAGPITGLLIQPIIGSMSDRTWNRLGRRRPYFLAGAILASTALFFMPNSSAVWNARVKDALEDRLHDLVCDGRLDLATAQRDISSDWIAAYKKYFETDEPLQ